mgnify:CR=1 FL=1
MSFINFHKPLCFVVIATCALCTSVPALSQGSDELMNLLNMVETNKTVEAQRNAEREARFRAEANQQQSMMEEAEAEVRRQEALRDQLRASFDENETQLAELQTVLDRRIGDLGELFGVFRQMADDTETMLIDSLITHEYPERMDVVSELAESTQVPTIPQMRSLWEALIKEIALSGVVSRFDADVVQPGGEKATSTVIRVGSFNVVSEDAYLKSEGSDLVELPRQPAGYVTSTAEDLTSASANQEVGFYIDPSRGALLGLLVQSPSLMERVEQGKTVGYAIIIVGIFGLIIVAARFLALARIETRMKKQLKNLDHPDMNNPLGRVINVYYENKHLDLETIKHKLSEVIFKDVTEIKKGLPIIKVLAAVAPLMGLLGTVTGMIGTFQAITLFGTGDPKLMAGGISQALITTVLGLCAAIPLLLTHSMLASRVTVLTKTIGEQSAALMSEKAESDATLKG